MPISSTIRFIAMSSPPEFWHHYPPRPGALQSNPRRKLTMEIKILDARLHDWGLPRFQSEMAAALDLYACLDEAVEILPGEAPQLISAGIALHIADPGIAALVLPRSGLGH